jgi:hypothetical protein
MNELTEHSKPREGGAGLDGRLVAKKISRDGSDAIRVADDRRLSVTADLAPDGTASYEITGSSRQNETGVVDVCTILADRLRADGLPVGVARKALGEERGIDCEIACGTEILRIQVTRPATSDDWKELSCSGQTRRKLDTGEAVSDLLALVRTKGRKTAPMDRRSTILAIDATETVVHAIAGVVESFRRQHAMESQAIGFAAVWVVGPECDSVHRLDVNEGC